MLGPSEAPQLPDAQRMHSVAVPASLCMLLQLLGASGIVVVNTDDDWLDMPAGNLPADHISIMVGSIRYASNSAHAHIMQQQSERCYWLCTSAGALCALLAGALYLTCCSGANNLLLSKLLLTALTGKGTGTEQTLLIVKPTASANAPQAQQQQLTCARLLRIRAHDLFDLACMHAERAMHLHWTELCK